MYRPLFATAIVTGLSVAALPAFAGATGDEILAALEGNTVQGSMASGDAYTEFYDADGTIKAADYTGSWSIEGDTMCFEYGEGPTCYGVRIDGDQVTWVLDGTDDGTGTILSGNPSSF